MTATTPSLRPTTPFQTFENTLIAEATKAGRPVERLAIPSVPFPDSPARTTHVTTPVMVLVTRRSGRLRMSDLRGDVRARQAVTPEDVADVVLPKAVTTKVLDNGTEVPDMYDSGGVVVVPDRETASLLMLHARRSDRPDLFRALTLSASLPGSSRFVVLTKALALKFVAPQGYDDESLSDWAEAFGMERPKSILNIPGLLARCYGGEGGGDGIVIPDPDDGKLLGVPNVLRMVAQRESAMLRSAAYSGVSAECRQFGAATQVTNGWAFLLEADAVGRRRHRVDGTVADLEWLSGKRARILGPFKFREGQKLVALPGNRMVPDPSRSIYQVVVDTVTVSDDGSYVVELDSIGAEAREVLHSGEQVAFIRAPFLMGGGRSGTSRWSAQPAEASPWQSREVPLSVSLAGAPRE